MPFLGLDATRPDQTIPYESPPTVGEIPREGGGIAPGTERIHGQRDYFVRHPLSLCAVHCSIS